MSFWAFSDTLCKFPNPQGHCVLNWVLGGGFVRKSVHWLKWICFTQILLKVSKYHKKNWYFPNLKKKTFTMFCHYTSSKFSLSLFEFSLKVKVMGLNPGYFLKSFLLVNWRRKFLICHCASFQWHNRNKL